jgi:hypothetical protein
MVGTAMATSGAAVSPQMGSASQQQSSIPLTLLNMRLGRWVPNPDKPEAPKWYAKLFWALLFGSGNRPGGYYYLKEMFIGTNEEDRWVYVSDGGHFENLGIYELVRRRCRWIISVDAGADPHREFSDLGKAIQQCRVDFAVDIEIDTAKLAIVPDDGRSESAFSIGRINYPETQDSPAFTGTLIYIKPSIPKDWENLGEDIHSYRAQHPEFPHEPTMDQWFSEAQFESYRYLGYRIGTEVIQSSDI